MGRVNAFLEAGNENRSVSVGGRGGQANSVWAWLNTDNRCGSAAIRVKAEVVGNTDSKTRRLKRAGGDNRTSIFTVELPDPSEAVEVHLVEKGHALKQLAAIGAALCLVKGVHEAETNPSHAKTCVRFGIETLLELEAEIGKNIPNVILPGNITLAHALACVEIVRGLQDGKEN